MGPDAVEVQRAYALIRERIITLAMRPGAAISVLRLAEDLGLSAVSVMEALQLLAHDDLVVITAAHEHGIYVSHVHLAILDQLSETRLRLEALSARLAAQRVTADDIAVMEALLANQASTPVDEPRLVLEIDHRLHQAIAQATGNTYLVATLERFFGLSQRLWYLVLPRLAAAGTLPAAVRMHVDLLEAIRSHDAAAAERIMREHVGQFYEQVRGLLTAQVTVHLGNDTRVITVDEGSLLSGAVIAAGLPLEQPCAGRGTCGKCKTIAEGSLSPLDEREQALLTPGERTMHFRLACRAQVMGDVDVTLAPIVVYSDKIFRASNDHLRAGAALGLAIDLGSTTVAAFISTLEDGQVCVGGAALNQQTAFGADVISRLGAAQVSAERASRLSALARSSIVQAIDALKLPPSARARIRKATIVGNCAMHHLLLGYPTDTLAELPFQPYAAGALRFPSNQDLTGFQKPVRSEQVHNPLADILPPGAELAVPPLIGGFVGSDALACLVYYGFDRATEPMAAIDLGTNGEVMITDGAAGNGRRRIVVGSTAAGPAFEGVNISCGTRAVDGAIVEAEAKPGGDGRTGTLLLKTVGDGRPVGLTGSGLLALVRELRRAGIIEPSGRFVSEDHPRARAFGQRFSVGPEGVRRFLITDEGVDRRGIEEGEDPSADGGVRVSLYLTQYDIRELQKAKGAIRATIDTLLQRLNLAPADLKRMILTGSFGSQLNVDAAVELGMIPPVPREVIETSVNGAGLGAAVMLDDAEFARGERIAAAAEQVELDLDPGFDRRFVRSMALVPGAIS
ncbi:MAG: ASKHA domain-containing protein [Nitrososphaerales archaeon]